MAPTAARASLARLSPPVWRILLHSLLFGLALSVADLLFNFYLASLGYGADAAGLLSTVSRGAGMLVGVPMGLLIDRLGSQRSLLLGVSVFCGGWVLLLVARELWALMVAQFIVGAAYLLASTAVTPLLTGVTRDADRANVFGLNASAGLIIGLIGSVGGGLLPSAAGGLLGVGPQDAAAYRLALGTVIALGAAALLPVLGALPTVEEARPAGASGAAARLLSPGKLLLLGMPSLTLGIAGGLFLPFQNLFFREVFGLGDAAVGVMLAAGALGMGVGALIGSPVTARLGLRRGAALLRFGAVGSMLLMLIPLLAPALAGFFLRGLFVAASFPQMDALAMRHTPPAQRGLIMSMMSVLWAGGWALAAVISGVVQTRWGFAPVIIAAAVTYVASTVAIIILPLDKGQPR
jgi:MFS family permease